MFAAWQPGCYSPAAEFGRLRPHHTRARHSQTLPPRPAPGYLCRNRFREVFEGNPDLAEIHPPELAALRRFRPQLCLNFHGGTRSAWMTELSGARYRAGFGHYRQQFVYNVRIPRAQEILHVDRKVHTAEHVASAIFFLGAPICEIPRAKLVARATGWRTDSPTPGSAVIHAVAATPEKTWRAENFLAIAGHLAQSGLCAGIHRRGRRRPGAFRAVPHTSGLALARSNRCSPAPRCSPATIPVRPTWRLLSECPPWSSSAPATRPSGDRGAAPARWSPRLAA